MTNFVPSRILVAGGAGFIGSHLVNHLLKDSRTENVTVVDNFSTGNLANLVSIQADSRLRIIEADITDETILTGKFDLILHLAAIANPTDYEQMPLQTLLVNSRGNERLIQVAKANRARYIFFSSSEVYGNYDHIPPEGLRESAVSHLILNQPRSPYPIGKCFGEEITKYYCRLFDLPHIIIRPFNVYGPQMDTKTNYGRVIPNFIHWALRKEPLQVQGNGHQIRTFCYIDDFIAALDMVIHHPSPPSVINIGSPIPTTIIELAHLINELLANDAGILYTERYPYETLARIPDIQRIQSMGWKPTVELRDGILKTIAWLQRCGSNK